MVKISRSSFTFLLKNRGLKISTVFIFLLISCLSLPTAHAGNKLYNGTKVKVLTGTHAISTGNFVINDGATYANNGILLLHGNLSNNNATANQIGNVNFAGLIVQTISGQNILEDLTINNPSGVSLLGDTKVDGSLSLSDGTLTLGDHNLALGPAATISGGFSSSKMIVATGTGELRKTFPLGFTGNFVFPVGDKTDASEYSPVIVNFSTGIFEPGNYLGVNLRNAKYTDPSITDNYLNRYWNITQSLISQFTCSAIFQYVPADVVGNENLILAKRVAPPPVLTYGPANISTHQLTVNDITAFGTYTGSAQTVPSLTGPTVACKDAPGNIYTTDANKTNYIWQVSAGGLITGGGTSTSNTVTITWIAAGPQTVSVTYDGASGPTVLNVTVLGPTITGSTQVCKLSTRTYTTQPGMTDYNWIVNGGLKVGGGGPTDNTVTVFWTGVGSRYVKVTYTNGTCTSTTTLTVIVNTSSPTIVGPSNACVNNTSSYSTDQGMLNYKWTVSAGGTIYGPDNTPDVQVHWNVTGNQYVYCIYTSPYGCPISKTTFKTVIWDPPVPTISGPTVVILGSSATYTTESGNYLYTWGVSSGGTIVSGGSGYSYAQVTWNDPGAQYVSVNYSNAGLCSAENPTVLPVQVNPGGSAPVSGQNAGEASYIYYNKAGEQKGDLEKCSIHPVPNDGRFTISFNSSVSESYSITIYNSLGKEIYQVKDIPVQGSFNLPVDLSHVADGVYTVLINNSISQASKRIIIRK